MCEYDRNSVSSKTGLSSQKAVSYENASSEIEEDACNLLLDAWLIMVGR